MVEEEEEVEVEVMVEEGEVVEVEVMGRRMRRRRWWPVTSAIRLSSVVVGVAANAGGVKGVELSTDAASSAAPHLWTAPESTGAVAAEAGGVRRLGISMRAARASEIFSLKLLNTFSSGPARCWFKRAQSLVIYIFCMFRISSSWTRGQAAAAAATTAAPPTATGAG